MNDLFRFISSFSLKAYTHTIMKKLYFMALAAVSAVLSGCSDHVSAFSDNEEEEGNTTSTDFEIDNIGYVTDGKAFDWETVDQMPTPKGQSRISIPWTGQGALMQPIDVVNDHKKADGWTLLYTSFTNETTLPRLENPFFALYNKYRGIMRVYLYLTERNVDGTAYMQDALTVQANGSNVKLLNFMGSEVTDGSYCCNRHAQLEPANWIGGVNLNEGCWYMMQYELAYDPSLQALNSDSVRLVLDICQRNVATADVGSGLAENLHCVVGEHKGGVLLTDNKHDDIISKGVVRMTGRQSIIGKTTAEGNYARLSGALYAQIAEGVKLADAKYAGNGSGRPVNLFNAVIGGTRDTKPTVSLAVSTGVKLSGVEKAEQLVAPPIKMYLPGVDVPAGAHSAYRPMSDLSLGVCNMTVTPDFIIPVKVFRFDKQNQEPDDGMSHITLKYAYPPLDEDFTKYLLINPDLKKIADVSVRQEIVPYTHDIDYLASAMNLSRLYSCSGAEQRNDYFNQDFEVSDFNVRFTITVTPKDGAPKSVIYKTFRLNPVWKETVYDYEPTIEDINEK